VAPINGDKVHVLTPFHSRSLYVENRFPDTDRVYDTLYKSDTTKIADAHRRRRRRTFANEQNGKVNVETARIRVYISYIGRKSLVVLMEICDKGINQNFIVKSITITRVEIRDVQS